MLFKMVSDDFRNLTSENFWLQWLRISTWHSVFICIRYKDKRKFLRTVISTENLIIILIIKYWELFRRTFQANNQKFIFENQSKSLILRETIKLVLAVLCLSKISSETPEDNYDLDDYDSDYDQDRLKI